MSKPPTDMEVAQALAEMRAMLAVLVAHAGVEDEVRAALAQLRAAEDRSGFEIERSLGQALEPESELGSS